MNHFGTGSKIPSVSPTNRTLIEKFILFSAIWVSDPGMGSHLDSSRNSVLLCGIDVPGTPKWTRIGQKSMLGHPFKNIFQYIVCSMSVGLVSKSYQFRLKQKSQFSLTLKWMEEEMVRQFTCPVPSWCCPKFHKCEAWVAGRFVICFVSGLH